MRRLRALALLLVMGACGGVHIAFSKLLGVEDVGGALAALSLYMGATSAILLALALSIGRCGWRWSAVQVLALTGAFAYFAPLLIELLVAPRIDAALFAMVEALEPAMATALAAVIALEAATRRRLTAVGLAVAAGILLYGPKAALPSSDAATWVAAAFLAPLCYSMANVYLAWRWPEGMSVLAVSAGEAGAGFLLCLFVTLAYGVTVPAVVEVAREGGVWLACLTAVSVTNAYLAVYLVRTESAVFVSFGGIVSLATGVLAGVTIFGERPEATLWLACICVAASLWLLRGADAEEADDASDAVLPSTATAFAEPPPRLSKRAARRARKRRDGPGRDEAG